MESEYFQTSWKVKLQQIRRRVRYLLKEVKRSYKKKKGYTQFLTEEEQSLRWIVQRERDMSIIAGVPYSP